MYDACEQSVLRTNANTRQFVYVSLTEFSANNDEAYARALQLSQHSKLAGLHSEEDLISSAEHAPQVQKPTTQTLHTSVTEASSNDRTGDVHIKVLSRKVD